MSLVDITLEIEMNFIIPELDDDCDAMMLVEMRRFLTFEGKQAGELGKRKTHVNDILEFEKQTRCQVINLSSAHSLTFLLSLKKTYYEWII